MKPLRILHTESHCQWGGQERRVFTECQWMHQQGNHIILTAPKSSPIYENARAEGWETYDVSFTRLSMLKDYIRLRSLFRKLMPDILNTHGNTDSKVALAAARGLGIPCIIRSRHSTPPVRNSWYNRLLYKTFSHYILTTANCITTQLMTDLDIAPERIFTLPSGISPPPELPEHETARQSLITELGLSPDTRFIGFVGRLSIEKGLPVLMDAFSQIKDELPTYHLAIVGEGDVLALLEKQARDCQIENRVHFLGYRDNPWQYFRAFDVHVLASSRYEGVPQVILQAMFARCPVIGTDAGGIPDVIDHENTGLLVPPDNPGQLAAAILHTLKDPEAAHQRVENAFRYVCANHTLDVMGNKILDIYRFRIHS